MRHHQSSEVREVYGVSLAYVTSDGPGLHAEDCLQSPQIRMHRVLLITELLSRIFQCCCEGNVGDDFCYGISNVALAARVCKAWKDPALDIVWRAIPSARFAFQLLLDDNRKWFRYLSEEDLPAPGSWRVFDNYARRIRNLRETQCDDKETHNILICIATRPFGERASPLFPYLQTLTLNILDNAVQIIATRFISQTLTALEFVVDVSMSLELLSTQRPVAVTREEFPLFLKKLLAGLSGLRRVTLERANLSDCLQTLASIPALEYLKWSQEFGVADQFKIQTHGNTLSNLREFHCGKVDIDELLAIFSLLDGSRLKTISISTILLHLLRSRDPPVPMTAIAKCAPFLEHLCITLPYRKLLPFAFLSPLGSCTQLKSLRIIYHRVLRGFVDISDLELDSFLSGLPGLVDLHIVTPPYRDSPPSLTLGGLRALVRHCRDLESVRISVDATSLQSLVPAIPSKPLQPLPRFQIIGFGGSPVDETRTGDIANFIRSLSVQPPTIDCTCYYYRYERSSHFETWGVIANILEASVQNEVSE